MPKTIKLFVFYFVLFFGLKLFAQTDSLSVNNDSLVEARFQDFNQKLAEIEQQRVEDSIKKVELENELKSLKTTDNLRKEELQKQLEDLKNAEKSALEARKNRIDSLRKNAKEYPVLGVLGDTIFTLYTKRGASTPEDRVKLIGEKIKGLYHDDFLNLDSLIAVKDDKSIDITYNLGKKPIIMSVSETDALWSGKDIDALANGFLKDIKASIIKAQEANTWQKWLMRIGSVILVIILMRIFIWLIGKFINYLSERVKRKREKWFKGLSYKDYTFMSVDQIAQNILLSIKVLKWVLYALTIYSTLTAIFGILPFSKGWADQLLEWIWIPIKGFLGAIWDYLPNLFSILVIYFVMRYVIKFTKYVFSEIKAEKLKIYGFYPDWAMPTFNILRFLLYAFMLILIFPYLPGSDSDIFKGVSIFVGVLFSLGSSSAISSMIAGLVITYMRPFKIGDRIKIGDVTGDVVEKTLLITRLKTSKNELVTIPNSSILSGNTINYSSEAEGQGLIIHTTVTIGYDVPWKDMYKALKEAANRTEFLLKEPEPFILQTSLDDFYVSYEINAYTKEPNKQARIYSDLHQNIQDACNEMGIEILSPHYRAERDGNPTTIPSNYKSKK